MVSFKNNTAALHVKERCRAQHHSTLLPPAMTYSSHARLDPSGTRERHQPTPSVLLNVAMEKEKEEMGFLPASWMGFHWLTLND